MIQFLRNLFIFFTFFAFLISAAKADKFPPGYPECWADSKNPVRVKPNEPEQFCPMNTKVGHTFFLVDFTSPLKKAQVDWIKGRIFGNSLIKTISPYHKISYMKIDETKVQSQKIYFTKCRFKTGNKSKFPGEETNEGCEGHKKITDAHAAFVALSSKFKKEFMANYEQEALISLIYEYLFHILREPVSDFTSEYPVRELVIVSDLMQHGKRFSFYSHCKTKLELSKPNKCESFEKLLKNTKVKDYIDTRKPNKDMLKNLKVTILYINHDYETRPGLSKSLLALWKDLFDYIGIKNYEIVKQLAIE